MKISNSKDKINFQIILVDFLIISMIGILLFVNMKDVIIGAPNFNLKNYVLSTTVPLLFVSLTGLGFGLFVEYKFNKLKFKNIFLLLGLILIFINTINALALPNDVVVATYNGKEYIYHIKGSERFFSIVYGLVFGLTPYLMMYVLPRRLNNNKYIKFSLYLILFIASLMVLASFVVDFDAYKSIIKSGFTDFSKFAMSLLNAKYTYSLFLFCGVIVSIYLRCLTNKKSFLFFTITFLLASIFTYSKLPVLLMYLYFLSYLIIRFILYVKKTKENLIITLLIASFIILIISICIYFIIISQSGILFHIKQIYINILNNSKSTISSRITIWQSALGILKPYQFIFGFGFFIANRCMQLAYAHHPDLAESPDRIWHCHNAIVESTINGGIILVLFNIFVLGALIHYSKKIYKYNKLISIMGIVIVPCILVGGITDSVILFSDSQYVFYSLTVIVPIMSIYYAYINKDEVKRKNQIVKDSKTIENIYFNNKFLDLNKKYLRFTSKCIKLDK